MGERAGRCDDGRRRRWHAVTLWALLLSAAGCTNRSSVEAPRRGSPVPSASSGARPPKEATTSALALELKEFRPILDEPALFEVARAVDAEDYVSAMTWLERRIAEPPKNGPERTELTYLLGRFAERLEQHERASLAFREASRDTDWALGPVARLAAARHALLAGDPAAAERDLGALPRGAGIETERTWIRAELLEQVGQRGEAIELLRAQLSELLEAPAKIETGLRLAEMLDRRQKQASANAAEDLEEILRLATNAVIAAPASTSVRARAAALEASAFAALDEAGRARVSEWRRDLLLDRAEALADAGRFNDAVETAQTLITSLHPERPLDTSRGCRASLIVGRALAHNRETKAAVAQLSEVADGCRDPEVVVRAAYLVGTQTARLERCAEAVIWLSRVEEQFPEHRLADDARLRRAQCYTELGFESRATELLARFLDDYPRGDMTREGVFQLVLRRLVRGDWPGAAAVLERTSRVEPPETTPRTQLDREAYFLSRARLALGETELGLQGFEELVVQRPFSVYMLFAYSRLLELAPERASAALERGLSNSLMRPFGDGRELPLDESALERVAAFLRFGEFEAAERELERVKLSERAAPATKRVIAELYVRSGVPRAAVAFQKRYASAWAGSWPSGDFEEAWRVAYPRPHAALVSTESRKNGLEEALVYAIMREESEFDEQAVSHAHAYGLMQLIVPTAKTAARGTGLGHDSRALLDPRTNIILGCRVLGDLMRRFDGEMVMAIAGYNAGPGRPRRWKRERPALELDIWIESIPYAETRNYVKRVLCSRAVYGYLYGDPRSAKTLELPRALRVE